MHRIVNTARMAVSRYFRSLANCNTFLMFIIIHAAKKALLTVVPVLFKPLAGVIAQRSFKGYNSDLGGLQMAKWSRTFVVARRVPKAGCRPYVCTYVRKVPACVRQTA